MNKKKFIISVSSILAVIILFFTGRHIYKTFNPSSGILLTADTINEMKKNINRDTILNSKDLKLISFEGNSNYVSLKFQDGNISSPIYDYYLLYNKKNNKYIKEIKEDNYTINVEDASLIKYIGNNEFIIISSKGEVYKYSPKKATSKLLYIGSSSIRRDNTFKDTFYNNSVYVITRNILNDFNEKSYDKSSVIQITCETKNNTKLSIKEYPLNKDDLAFSFVFDNNGSIGILRSSSIDISLEFLKPYVDNIMNFIQKPTSKEKIRLVNTNDISVLFFNEDNREAKIDRKALTIASNDMFDAIYNQYSINIGYNYNVPILLNSDKSIFSQNSYDNMLSNNDYSNSSLATYYDLNNFKEGNNLDIKLFNIVNFKYKDYIVFARTNVGYIGIKKDGSYDKIIKFNNVFIYDNSILYEENNNIFFSTLK